jgi:hypothetical protein
MVVTVETPAPALRSTVEELVVSKYPDNTVPSPVHEADKKNSSRQQLFWLVLHAARRRMQRLHK